MLLTITTTHRPASDLGYLLHKHPDKFQSFDLSFGQAHAYYPEVGDDRCTACLLLDVDAVGLVRGRNPDQDFLLAQYVNDRPYVASSFLSVAIAQVFGSALNGRCKDRPELVTTPLPLEARLDVLPVRGGEGFLRAVFEPLGYAVEAARHPLDERFPEWGESPYFSVTIRRTVTLSELLSHLYVLVPVFDAKKHYFVGHDETEKLLAKGEGWLAGHPAKDEIARRYLGNRASLYKLALSRLVGDEEPDEDETPEREPAEVRLEKPISLNDQRLGSVVAALRASGAKRVLDLGCGEGKLIRELLKDRQFDDILGLDVSIRTLEIAARRLKLERLPDAQANRVKLLHGSLMYRDKRLAGFDAAAVVEVVEHLDPPAGVRAGAVRVRPAPHGGADHAQPRVQLDVGDAARRHVPPRRPPLRVDAGRVPGVGRRGGESIRVRRAVPARRPGTPRARLTDADGSVHPVMKISIPKLSLVVLVGPSGSGKSTFARKRFLPTEVLSSDACRAMLSDDENNQAVTNEAFALLHYVAAQRLALGKLTVIDATNVQPEARKPLVELARKYHCLPVAVVLNLPEEVCHERNRSRSDRSFGPHVIRNQRSQLRRSLRGLQREGFRHIFVLETPEQVEAAVVERVPLWNDRTGDAGPFDIIGDVHGCADELEHLLGKLGYGRIVIAGHEPGWSNVGFAHPEGRKVVFVGDLVDRGPRVLDTLRIVSNMVQWTPFARPQTRLRELPFCPR
jgi:3' terminal RNA ribose 2'-O-methyltransferase Hen1